MICIRWTRWRRDLLAGLVGALLATGASVPIFQNQLRMERERADSERGRTESAEREMKAEMESSVKEAEELRTTVAQSIAATDGRRGRPAP